MVKSRSPKIICIGSFVLITNGEMLYVVENGRYAADNDNNE